MTLRRSSTHTKAFYDSNPCGSATAWKASGETLNLVDEEPNTFALFVENVYRNQPLPPVLAETEEGENKREPEPKKRKVKARGRHDSAKKLIKLYIFADMRQCHQLKCAAMDAYRKRITGLWKNPTRGLLSLIYDPTPPKCGMRRCVVDWFARSCVPRVQAEKDIFWASATMKGEITRLDAPRDFLLELAMVKTCSETRPIRTREEWLKVVACDYYGHKGEDSDDTAAAEDDRMYWIADRPRRRGDQYGLGSVAVTEKSTL